MRAVWFSATVSIRHGGKKNVNFKLTPVRLVNLECDAIRRVDRNVFCITGRPLCKFGTLFWAEGRPPLAGCATSEIHGM